MTMTLLPNQMTNTHILVPEFTYLAPTTLAEALALAAQYGARAAYLAGGTNLLIDMKMEHRGPEYVIYIGRLAELRGLTWGDDGLRIGALTSIQALNLDALVRDRYRALARACGDFGSTQIQIMGTLGGNVCNGSPASDTVPPLLVFDASLELTGPAGARTMSLEDFLLGPGKTARRPDELLTAVHLPTPKPGTGSSFVKVARVRADLAKASVAAMVVRDGDLVVDCRLAYGSVGPTVARARDAEAVLIGKRLSPELALEAGRVASEAISPIDDVRSTAWYRREVVKAITHDALLMAWEDAATEVGAAAGAEAVAAAGAAHTTTAPDTVAPPMGEPGRRNGSTLHVGPADLHTIHLTVNGAKRAVAVASNDLLLNVVREQLALTGTKYGCGIGECGACTVDLNGEPVMGCLVLALTADGAHVSTVEGLAAPDGTLDPLQDAFIEHNGFQCGYCTPGMLVMTKALLRRIGNPSEAQIRDWLKGNRCRCTGFASIVRSVQAACEEPASEPVIEITR